MARQMAVAWVGFHPLSSNFASVGRPGRHFPPSPFRMLSKHGAHDVLGAAATVASVVQWAFAFEVFPSPASLEELEKEDLLDLASNGSLIIPLGMKATTGTVHRASLSRGGQM